MKKLLTKLISVCFAVTILLSATITAFAAEDDLTINGEAKVKVGDKVKFSLYLDECTEEIIGYEMRIMYDHDYLELDNDSITYEKFNGVMQNLEVEDCLPFCWTNISQPADFSSKALFISLEFKVLKGGETEISQFVTDMYGDDMTYLKSYKWTYDISVNDESIVADKVPPVSQDEKILSEKQGSFVNYVDGMGEENTPNKDDHQAVTGVVKRTQTATEIVNVTQYQNVDGSSSSGGGSTVLIIVIAVLIVGLAAVAIVIVKKRDDSAVVESTDNTLEENSEDIAD